MTAVCAAFTSVSSLLSDRARGPGAWWQTGIAPTRTLITGAPCRDASKEEEAGALARPGGGKSAYAMIGSDEFEIPRWEKKG